MKTPSEARARTRKVIELILALGSAGDLEISGFTKNVADETMTGVAIKISSPIKLSDLDKVTRR